MDYITSNLYPAGVFKYFEEISKIPRGSGNEKAVSDYLVTFAKSHGLEVTQDTANNVIIKKPGTEGYENSAVVIIQGHMDMVCDKNKSKVHDFEKDPLKLKIDGDMLYADSTTLGADDGVAVAYGLAILASNDIPHPPLEIIMTTEEEVGLCGAAAMDTKDLNGKYLINLDYGIEGEFLAGCSGGVRMKISLPIKWQNVPEGFTPYRVGIKGLKGGHSGGEIDLGRGNSNKLLGRVLDGLMLDMKIYINELNGGLKTNAIPREADAVLFVEDDKSDKLLEKIKQWDGVFKRELRLSDPGVCVITDKIDSESKRVFSDETSKKSIAALMLIPNGIHTMSMEIDGLVESSMNLGILYTSDTNVVYEGAIRSSSATLKYNIRSQCRVVAEILDAGFEYYSDYPGWEYNDESSLLSKMKDLYKRMYNTEPEIVATHAGVECGIFKGKMPGLDLVCIGPNMIDVHTPNEHLDIPSTGRVWDFLIALLKEMK